MAPVSRAGTFNDGGHVEVVVRVCAWPVLPCPPLTRTALVIAVAASGECLLRAVTLRTLPSPRATLRHTHAPSITLNSALSKFRTAYMAQRLPCVP